MLVTAPITNDHDLAVLAEHGIAEVYCGVVEEQEAENRSNFLNRRTSKVGNFENFGELKKAIELAHQNNIKVNFVLNDTFYQEKSLITAIQHAKKAIEINVDAFIVADPILLKAISNFFDNIYLSTTASCQNSESISWFNSLGVKRIVLPRHMELNEIKAIVQKCPETMFEVIVMGDPCHWDDGFCCCEHNLHLYDANPIFFGGLCSKMMSFQPIHDINEENLATFMNKFTLHSCGLCALWDLRSAGVQFVKTTNRDDPDLRIILAKYIPSLISVLEENSLARDEFFNYARDIRYRIFNEFIAFSVMKAREGSSSDTEFGERANQKLMKARLVECEPPFSCYFPELW